MRAAGSRNSKVSAGNLGVILRILRYMSVGGGLSLIRDTVPIEAKRSALVSWGLERQKHMFTHLFDCDMAIAQ